MLINATHPEEHRVVIVEDGILEELDIEVTSKEQTRGNIYKAVVVRVETGLQAAFVDFGSERPGFLQIGEIHPSFQKEGQNGESRGRPRINDLLRRGQELLVQVVKEERGSKGAALTTYLSLPGRYMVLMPESDTKGVSRKIEQESQRKKLKETMASLELPENIGYIVRTAGIGQKKTELKRDVDYLMRVYEKILDLSKKVKAPVLVYKESNLVIRSIRDYFSADIDEVLVDDPGAAQEAKDFFEEVMPEYGNLVKLHQERRPIFARYQIEEQIESISRNKVALPSGGSIVIDSTEALVAVDVNSGKMASEQGVEATAFKSNMEAAGEIARHLRLRDLGGLIVIDFIDMRDRKHIRDVEKRLKDALKVDKARVTVGRISQFGLLEMSRQRIKSVLAAASYLPCPHCEGTGRIKSAETQALDFLRRVYTGMAKGHVGHVEAEIPLEVASYILNLKRGELMELERHYSAVITIKGRPEFIAGQMEITFHKREKEHQITTQQYIDAASGRPELSGAPETAAEPAPRTESEPRTEPEQQDQVESTTVVAKEEPAPRKRRRPRRRRKSTDTETEKGAAEGSTEQTRPDSLPVAATSTDGASELSHDTTRESTPPRELDRNQQQPQTASPPAGSATAETSEAAPEGEPRVNAQKSNLENEKQFSRQEISAESAGDQAVPEDPATQVPEKPHRKRRRRKPSGAAKPVESNQSGVGEVDSTPAPVTEPPPVSGTEQEDAAPKPQRPPRPRRKPAVKKPAEQTASSEAPAVAESIIPTTQNETTTKTDSGQIETEAVQNQDAKASPQPAARRPRRPAKAKTATGEETGTASAETTGGAAAEPAQQHPAEEAPIKKKPARRPRRKPAGKPDNAAKENQSDPDA